MKKRAILLCLFYSPCFVALERIPLHSSSFSSCSDKHKKIKVICSIHSGELQIEPKNLGNELLVYGFIREFEPKVTNKIIPDCIMNLCVGFSRRMLPCDCIKGRFRKILPQLDIDENRKKVLIFFLMYKIENVQDEKDTSKKTILHCTCKGGHLRLAKLLRKWGTNLNAKDKDGNNALHYACAFSGSVPMVTWLLDVCKIGIEAKGRYERTSFLLATEKGQIGIAKLLKERGANIKVKDGLRDNALHMACLYSGSIEMTKWLLNVCKIGIETKGCNQRTPFFCAARKEKLDIAKLLKERGASINAEDKFGNNALHYACLYSGSVEMTNWLLDECKLDIESKGQYERTPFLCAAEKGQLEIAKLLKDRGANIHAKDKHGDNALHLATMFSKNKEMIRYLESQFKTGRGLNFWSSWF